MATEDLPRIDIVVVRDPDYENDVTVYVNGQVAEVNEWSFDPGAGYTYEDYMEMRISEVESAPEFIKPLIEQLYEDMRRTYAKWGFDWTKEQRSGEADAEFLAEYAKAKEEAK